MAFLEVGDILPNSDGLPHIGVRERRHALGLRQSEIAESQIEFGVGKLIGGNRCPARTGGALLKCIDAGSGGGSAVNRLTEGKRLR